MNVFMSSDNLLKVSNIRLNKTDVAPTAITSVTAKLLDSSNNIVASSSITLVVDSGVATTYWGEFSNAVSLTEGATYKVELIVVADSKTYTARPTVVAAYAGFN
jgi:hypothetical protein